MQHDVNTGRFHHIIKGTLLSNVRDNEDLELASLDLLGVRTANLLRLFLGADGGNDRVVFLEELFKGVGCNNEWRLEKT